MTRNRLRERHLLKCAAAVGAFLANQTLLGQNPALQVTYAGSETCKACHEDLANAFRKSPHYSMDAAAHGKWEGKACEACHGPGSKHAETLSALDILNPATTSPKRADEDCLKCHFNQRTQVGRIRGSHVKNSVPCTACHSVHKGFNYLYPWKNLK